MSDRWSVFRKKNIMQGLFEWKWGFSFKSLICGRKKNDGLQCEKSKWFLDVISIPGCEYSRRQPEPDEWSPLPASTPPRGQTRGHWSLTPDSTTFSWLEDRLSVLTLMFRYYTSMFDILKHRHTCPRSGHPSPPHRHEERQLRLDKLLSGCWLLNLTNGAAVADTSIHCTQSNI